MPAHPAGPGRGAAPTGQRLGRYRLAQRIGEGGMGVVHLGVDEQGTAVAVKVLRPHIAGDPEARRRLGREVDSLRRVRHPRVAAVLDADVDGDVPYVVTQFVPGLSLDEHVREHGNLQGTALARLGNGLGEALAAIHAAGVVHRDLKPGNVLMLDGDPVVIDFGIAHVADDVRLTSTGLVMGTPGYLSPELVEGERVTQATDWWGWAATMTFAATGRSPFGRGPMEVVLDRVRRGAADLDGVPDALVPVLAAALSVDPANRPAPASLRLAVAELEAEALRQAKSLQVAEALQAAALNGAGGGPAAAAPAAPGGSGDSDDPDDGDAEVMPFLRPAAAGAPAAAAAVAAAPAVPSGVGLAASRPPAADVTQVVPTYRPTGTGEPATAAAAATTPLPSPAGQDDRTHVAPAGPGADWTTVLPAAAGVAAGHRRAEPTGAVPTTGLPTTGLPTTGLPTTGAPTAGLPTSSRASTGGSAAAAAAAASAEAGTSALPLVAAQQTRVLPAVSAAAPVPAEPRPPAPAPPTARPSGPPSGPPSAAVAGAPPNPYRQRPPAPQAQRPAPAAFVHRVDPHGAGAYGAPPSGPPAPSRQPSPAQQGPYRPLPVTADGQRPGPVPGGPQAPAPAATRGASPGPTGPEARPTRTGVLVAWAVAVAAVAGVLPVFALVAGLASVVLARTVDRTLGALHHRRYERGARRTDGARAVASAPWHAVTALLVSVPAVVLPLLVGASVAFIVGLASPSGPAPGESIPLFAGALAAAVTAWGGPGGGSVRRGSRAVARAVAPGPTLSNVVAAVLVVLALGAFVAAAERVWQPDWTPLQEAPFSADTLG